MRSINTFIVVSYAILIALIVLAFSAIPADAGRPWYRTSDGFVMSGRKYTLGVDDYCCGRASCKMQQELWQAFRSAQSAPTQQQAAAAITTVRHSFAPSPTTAVDALWQIIRPQPGQIILDPGCGDARILVGAARRFGAYGMGIEINPQAAALARSAVQSAGVTSLVSITEGDSRRYRFAKADYVVMYLYDDLIRELLPKLKSLRRGTVVVSYLHPMPAELHGQQRITVGEHVFFVWIHP
ncbi:cyclopropane-fatty-acyl-phospholipid synthase family protein [Stieleria sp.]|uniref:SAM-dependent methyltransferase n=1 Tax=Stieleria sp. TaxID=2795976 RepID=UPI0035623699